MVAMSTWKHMLTVLSAIFLGLNRSRTVVLGAAFSTPSGLSLCWVGALSGSHYHSLGLITPIHSNEIYPLALKLDGV